MTKEQKMSLLSIAYVTKKVDDPRREIVIINESFLPDEFVSVIKDLQFNLNKETQSWENGCEIMEIACHVIVNIPLEELKDADLYELSQNTASVDTDVCLSWLNNCNQEEISEIIHEFGKETDIATACAVWFERQVVTAAEMIRKYVLEDELLSNEK